MSGELDLRAAAHWRVDYPFAAAGSSALDNTRELASGLSSHLAGLQRLRGGAAPGVHVICSTILSTLLVDCHALASELGDGVRTPLTSWPEPIIVSAYECASWGYALRHLMSCRYSGDVVISIVDIDIHNFTHWERHSAWGASGFGVTSMWLDLAPPMADCVRVGAARSANGLMEFGRSIVEFNSTVPPGVRTHAPFFPAATRSMLERVTNGVVLAPNGHAEYGHSFGSDPWLSLLADLVAREPATTAQVAVLCSLALNGYFAIARLTVPAGVALDSKPWPRRAAAHVETAQAAYA